MDEDVSLRGRRALVCGASSGIGRAIAVRLAARGAGLAVLARREDALRDLASELGDAGGAPVRVIAADLEDRAALDAAADAALADGPVHVLVNNAGGPPGGPLLEADGEAFLAPFRRHVLAAHRLVQRLLPGMVEADYGRIVNVISTSVREPIPGLGVSNTVRGAMAAWAKTLARELPAPVTINNVLPGFTATGRLEELKATLAGRRGCTPEEVQEAWLADVPLGRLGRPEEIAAVAAFLASPAASYVRGQSIAADGGRIRAV